MIKYIKFIGLLVLGTIFSVETECYLIQDQYYSRLIDVNNDKEVSEVARILFYKKPRSNEERGAELVRAKSELLAALKDRKNIFVCISESEGTICGCILAEYGYRQADIAEYKIICISRLRLLLDDNEKIEFSMMNSAENFYKSLSMKGIVFDLDLIKHHFRASHGYVRLSTDQMIPKIASPSSYALTAILSATLVGVGSFCQVMKEGGRAEDALFVGAFFSMLSGTIFLPITQSAYEKMNSHLYYKAL